MISIGSAAIVGTLITVNDGQEGKVIHSILLVILLISGIICFFQIYVGVLFVKEGLLRPRSVSRPHQTSTIPEVWITRKRRLKMSKRTRVQENSQDHNFQHQSNQEMKRPSFHNLYVKRPRKHMWSRSRKTSLCRKILSNAKMYQLLLSKSDQSPKKSFRSGKIIDFLEKRLQSNKSKHSITELN